MNPPARLCVIPARGGSRRVPRKNVRPLGGRALLEYTVDAALESGCFDRVIVSTDDEGIAAAAIRAGAVVPFVRMASLADDHATVSDVVVDAVGRVDPEGARFDAVAQMMPTCPFRTAADVRSSLEHFERSAAPFQISVAPFAGQNPWWSLAPAPDGSLRPLFPDALRSRSQDLPTLYAPTGAIWWARPGALRQAGTFHGPGAVHHVLSWRSGFDIDTEDDLVLAEALLAAGRPESGA